MCETHEPPPEGHDTKTVVGIVPIVELGSMEEVSSTDKKDKKEPPQDFNSSGIPFIGDVRRGNICIFTSGYFDFFHETRLLVETIMEFMPGVKVAVATHPMDYHVYNRYVDASSKRDVEAHCMFEQTLAYKQNACPKLHPVLTTNPRKSEVWTSRQQL